MKLGTEHKHPAFLGQATVLYGWALAAQNRVEEGIAQVRQGIKTFRATCAQTWIPHFLGLQAESLGQANQIDDARRAVVDALAQIAKTEERCWLADLYRVKGELLQASGNDTEAEHCFMQALDIARRQRAKSWELRATVSLARLWQQQGKPEQAQSMLSEIYSWFTEGFDTADLKEAKTLLKDLSSSTDVLAG